MEIIKKGDVPPYNTFKGGIETIIGQLKFKHNFQIFAKKGFEKGLDEWKKRMEPKEYEIYVRTRIHGFDMLIRAYEDSIKKLEEILWRTGHLTFKLRRCKKCMGLFPPMDSITRFCIKHRENNVVSEGNED